LAYNYAAAPAYAYGGYPFVHAAAAVKSE